MSWLGLRLRLGLGLGLGLGKLARAKARAKAKARAGRATTAILLRQMVTHWLKVEVGDVCSTLIGLGKSSTDRAFVLSHPNLHNSNKTLREEHKTWQVRTIIIR